ncbi:hypothetical protein [Haloterrigena salifodinae]|uniref:Uncharacterized protein n=1 Tax=Haloterrigena salifodinae TaxID=2675099 RepID=A0A8T8E429_9EURY|nr:hypothetical protein [Haloterrigena salifodinae]QRV16605.1 hypothetical protein JMJ58_06930 [Haloterrigena salifodinae]
MTATDGPFECDTCDADVRFEEARRTKTMGGLDSTTWQTLCCPHCGSRLKTVYVGD